MKKSHTTVVTVAASVVNVHKLVDKINTVKHTLVKIMSNSLITYNQLITTQYQVAAHKANNITMTSSYTEAKDYLHDMI